MDGAIRIDRDGFLALVTTLALGCSASTPPPSQKTPTEAFTTVEIPAETTQETEQASGQEEELVSVATEASGACNNDVGEVDCSGISPGCEGSEGSCRLLGKGYGYKRRVAQAIASCWQRLGSRICDMGARKDCNLEGIRTACPDPSFVSDCRALLDSCDAANARIRYTEDECVLVLSSLTGAELAWARGAMGPSREGCRLMFPVY